VMQAFGCLVQAEFEISEAVDKMGENGGKRVPGRIYSVNLEHVRASIRTLRKLQTSISHVLKKYILHQHVASPVPEGHWWQTRARSASASARFQSAE